MWLTLPVAVVVVVVAAAAVAVVVAVVAVAVVVFGVFDDPPCTHPPSDVREPIPSPACG